LITGGKVSPPGSLVLGSPAKVVRALTAEERGDLKRWAERYVTLSRRYLKGDGQTAR
jgi:carbonic anhydrase/acetyltransferase-like protein (isoleucine patch superfamily)